MRKPHNLELAPTLNSHLQLRSSYLSSSDPHSGNQSFSTNLPLHTLKNKTLFQLVPITGFNSLTGGTKFDPRLSSFVPQKPKGAFTKSSKYRSKKVHLLSFEAFTFFPLYLGFSHITLSLTWPGLLFSRKQSLLTHHLPSKIAR